MHLKKIGSLKEVINYGYIDNGNTDRNMMNYPTEMLYFNKRGAVLILDEYSMKLHNVLDSQSYGPGSINCSQQFVKGPNLYIVGGYDI